MRWNSLFIPTLRDAPSDAEVVSHKLLLRAGYVRQLSAGLYCYLYLAQRSLRKIERIIREEMDAIGAQEIYTPELASGRNLERERPLGRDRRRHVPA